MFLPAVTHGIESCLRSPKNQYYLPVIMSHINQPIPYASHFCLLNSPEIGTLLPSKRETVSTLFELAVLRGTIFKSRNFTMCIILHNLLSLNLKCQCTNIIPMMGMSLIITLCISVLVRLYESQATANAT